MRHYVTACRESELPVLEASLVRWCKPFALHVLAWDWVPMVSGRRGEGWSVELCSPLTFWATHPDLRPSVGAPKTVNEQVCTARWQFLVDVMEATGEPATLIDGDTWFWSSPEPVYEEIGTAAVALSPHGFAPASAGLPGVTQESHGRYGRFNGGWSYWADFGAASWIAAANRRWSFARIEHFEGRARFGDQSWLEDVERRFGAHVVQHPGLNVGPWNLHARLPFLSADGWQPRLISYHYSSMTDDQAANPCYAVTAEQERMIYAPYRAARGWAQ